MTTMTRGELLHRLMVIEAQGGNMSLPVTVRVSRRVPDKRTRAGERTEELRAQVWAACGGELGYCDEQGEHHRSGELLARTCDGWAGEWHI